MPNPQSRQKLSPPDLIALLNWELAAYEECEGCRVTAIEPIPGSWKATAIVDSAEKQKVLSRYSRRRANSSTSSRRRCYLAR